MSAPYVAEPPAPYKQPVRYPLSGALARWLPELACLAVALVWGCTFLGTQMAVRETGIFCFLGLRFGIGAVALFPLFIGRMRGFTRAELFAGSLLGATLFTGYALLSLGLNYMSSSEAAFVTAVYIPLVPLLQLLLLKKSPSALAWVGVCFACIGLVLLSGGHNVVAVTFNRGELLVLGCAIASALEIVLISLLVHTGDVTRIVAVQLVVASALGWFAMLITGEHAPVLTTKFTFLILALGLSVAAVRATMFWAQRTVSATRATLLYATEPVWASIIGVIAGERMPLLAVIGCGCILLGVTVEEFRYIPSWFTSRLASRANARATCV